MKLRVRRWNLVLSGCLLLAANNAHANELKPYKASYEAQYTFLIPFKGTATRELSQSENGDWQISHKVTSAVMTLDESSFFQLENSEIIPSRYEYRQAGLGQKRHTLLEFDWSNKKLTAVSSKKGDHSYALPPQTLDKLTYQLQLRQELMAGKKPGEYQIADTSRLKKYTFELLGEEVLETRLGKLNTIKLKKTRARKAKRETLVWLATDWDYLVVQVHQTEKSKLYQITVTEALLDSKPVTGLNP